MKLTYDQIRAVTMGAVRIEEDAGTIRFFRFTEAEQQMYKARREESWIRSFATAGIRLEFDTDSSSLTFAAEVCPSTSRRFFTHSIFVNGKRIGEISGELPDDVQKTLVQKQFALEPGMKRISILLPWSVESRLLALELSDGAWLAPVKKKCRLLSYGDSITQGYDAEKPEDAYIVRLAEQMEAELICKAIGGERFCPQLAQLCDVEQPQLITVAYGTNDWSLSNAEEFLNDSAAFFSILAQKYPQVPLIALTPIWRADRETKITSLGSFNAVAAHFRTVAERLDTMKVVDGIDFVPHNPILFSDLRLHPNSMGFDFYSSSLIDKMKQIPQIKDLL